MTQAGKRVADVIAYLGLNKNSFSREIGMTSNVTIGRLLNEDRNPHPSTLQKIVNRFPQLNYNWLLTGEGSMLKSSPINSTDSERSEVAELLAAIKQHGEELRRQGERLDRMLDLVSSREKGAISAPTQSGLQKSPPLNAM